MSRIRANNASGGGGGYVMPPKEIVCTTRANSSGGFVCTMTGDNMQAVDASNNYTGTYLKTTRTGNQVDITALVDGNYMYKSSDGLLGVGTFTANTVIASLKAGSAIYTTAYGAYLD